MSTKGQTNKDTGVYVYSGLLQGSKVTEVHLPHRKASKMLGIKLKTKTKTHKSDSGSEILYDLLFSEFMNCFQMYRDKEQSRNYWI